MITELTKEQEEQLAVYKDKWLKIGLSTEPFTFDEAKELVDFYYKNIAKKDTVPIVISGIGTKICQNWN